MALGGGGISNRNKPSYVRMTTKSSHMIKKSIIKCQAMPQVSCILHSYVSGHATGTMDSSFICYKSTNQGICSV